jgi:NAD(P)H-flavin reductase
VPAGVPYHVARVVSRTDAGGGMTRLTLDPGDAVTSTYRSPGQYVEVRTRGETGYFVVAVPPGTRPWELVMRPGGGASDVILGPSPDADIEVTAALGDGFPVAELRGRPLVVALGGTGVAAGPPLLARRITDGDAALTRVFVGVRTLDEVPLEQEMARWRSAGIDVVLCSMQSEPLPEGSTAFRGFIQDAVIDRVPHGWAHAIIAVGASLLVDALRDVAPAHGLDRSRVLTNH